MTQITTAAAASAPSRIDQTFARLHAQQRKALVAYLCMGDPSLEQSMTLALEAVRAGTDILELGVPFSDPVADGPVIAEASLRAIKSGASLRKILGAARELRAQTDVPFVLFTYYNPVVVLGVEATIKAAAEAGIDSLLMVDLPPEESQNLRQLAKQAGLGFIPLLTPTTTRERRARIITGATDFLYYVSVTGVTGNAAPPLDEARQAAQELRAESGRPVVIGFGIDGPEKARAAAGSPGQGADGVVVGTALVRTIHQAPTLEARCEAVRTLLGAIRTGLDAPAVSPR